MVALNQSSGGELARPPPLLCHCHYMWLLPYGRSLSPNSFICWRLGLECGIVEVLGLCNGSESDDLCSIPRVTSLKPLTAVYQGTHLHT